MRIVVVGNGMAAVRLVEGLVGHHHDITVVSAEPVAPYNRILLSAVLEGSHREAAITLRPPRWYADHGVDLILGRRVTDIDRPCREAVLADDSRIGYDALVLATGSLPSLPPIRGLVGPDGRMNQKVHAFRSLADCHGLQQAVTVAHSAVVVGGGLLGLQVARALSVRGLNVEIVEGGEHLLQRQVDQGAAAVLQRSLDKLGTTTYAGAFAVGMTDKGLRLDNGYVLDTDMVVLTAGSRPNVRLARRAGLVLGNGVVVDDELRTSDRAIHAIGDCAEHAGRTTGFVPPAWAQASVLARILNGEQARYHGHRAVARLRATDLDVAVLGDPEHTAGEIVQVSNPITGTHKKLVVADGVVVAATLVGDLSRIGLITQAFDKRTVLGDGEPGALLLADKPATPIELGDDAEVCACAGVSAGRIRACSSVDQVCETTRATTGCGGCRPMVEQLLHANLVKGSA
ncbi:MAG: FAD-dependent oxidoreductase [Nocardioides sp.]